MAIWHGRLITLILGDHIIIREGRTTCGHICLGVFLFAIKENFIRKEGSIYLPVVALHYGHVYLHLRVTRRYCVLGGYDTPGIALSPARLSSLISIHPPYCIPDGHLLGSGFAIMVNSRDS